MLRASGNLTGFESQINKILSDGPGKGLAKNGKVFVRFIFGHDAGAGPVFGYDLFIVIDKAAVNSSHIAAVAAHMAANLADFLFVHFIQPR